MRKLASGCYAVLLVFLVAAPAAASEAAPQYESSEPSDGATVHEPPDRVEVTFDQPLDPGSSMTVTDVCDRQVDDRSTEVSGTTMSIGLEYKPSGRYLVEYVARSIGGLTGETKGSFTFTAHAGSPCGKGEGHGNGHGGHEDQGGGHGGNKNGHNSGGGHGGNKNGHNSGGHEDQGGGHGGTDHSATSTHSGSVHSAGSPEHSSGGTGQESDHGVSHNDRSGVRDGGTIDGITSSDTQRGLLTRADSTTLLISLALCAVLGIMGGAVLRATSLK